MITTLILLAVFRPSSSAPLAPTVEPIWRRSGSDTSDAPDVRTILDIVRSCVATIFACSWVALHPNLPDPHISGWSRFKHRLGVVILAILVPEFILIWALRQRLAAGSIMREYNRTVLKIDRDQKKSLICRVREWFQPRQKNDPSWTLTHGFYIQMGGFLLYNNETPVRVLHFRQLVKLIQFGLVDRPNVTEEDICDRSKGDFFSKAIVVAQTTWFIVHCTARWATRLPVTELEVMTLGFAVLNIITYWIWWEKPQNVAIAVRVQLKEEEISPQREEMDVTDSSRSQDQQEMDITVTYPEVRWLDVITRFTDNSWHAIRNATGGPLRLIRLLLFPEYPSAPVCEINPKLRVFVVGLQHEDTIEFIVSSPDTLSVGTFYAASSIPGVRPIIFAFAGGLLFWVFHLITFLSSVLPTTAELILWRGATICMSISLAPFPPLVLSSIFYFSLPKTNRRREGSKNLLIVFAALVLLTGFLPLLIYTFARVVVIVLAFTTLRSLPPDAYKEITWSSFIPHI